MRFHHIYESWYEALSLSIEIANWILAVNERIYSSNLCFKYFDISIDWIYFYPIFFFFNFIIFRYDNDDFDDVYAYRAMQFTRWIGNRREIRK